MSHVFAVPDEEYTRLEEAARKRGVTVDELFQAWVGSVTTADESDAAEVARLITDEIERQRVLVMTDYIIAELASLCKNWAPSNQ